MIGIEIADFHKLGITILPFMGLREGNFNLSCDFGFPVRESPRRHGDGTASQVVQ